MSIDHTHFTPWASLVGGMVIGLSATLYVLGLGRIAGIAGIVGGRCRGWSGAPCASTRRDGSSCSA